MIMKYIHSLTGLRGLAALMVFISHSANESLVPSVLGHGFGKIGVILFFMLSGFLMAHLYVGEDCSFRNIVRYAAARIGRIVPLYFLLVMISLVISHFVCPDFCYQFSGISSVLKALLFISAPSVFWTIPAEVQFYAVFLALWFLIRRFSKRSVLILFLLLTGVRVLFGRTDWFQHGPDFVVRYSYAFLLGVVTAFYYPRIRNSAMVRKVASIVAIPSILLLFLNLPVLRNQCGLFLWGNGQLDIWTDPITWTIVYSVFFLRYAEPKRNTDTQ